MKDGSLSKLQALDHGHTGRLAPSPAGKQASGSKTPLASSQGDIPSPMCPHFLLSPCSEWLRVIGKEADGESPILQLKG